MSEAEETARRPGAGRVILASAAVVLAVYGAWALIEHRSQPPAPPNPIGATPPAIDGR